MSSIFFFGLAAFELPIEPTAQRSINVISQKPSAAKQMTASTRLRRLAGQRVDRLVASQRRRRLQVSNAPAKVGLVRL